MGGEERGKEREERQKEAERWSNIAKKRSGKKSERRHLENK